MEYRLLVIEDDVRIADLICRVAMESGFIAVAAAGPREIERIYEQFHPDVITLDILMPDMDGLEVLQFLRQKFSAARIVILSGSEGLSHQLTGNMGAALGLTIAADIYKPFRIPALRRLFEQLKLSISESRGELPAEGAA